MVVLFAPDKAFLGRKTYAEGSDKRHDCGRAHAHTAVVYSAAAAGAAVSAVLCHGGYGGCGQFPGDGGPGGGWLHGLHQFPGAGIVQRRLRRVCHSRGSEIRREGLQRPAQFRGQYDLAGRHHCAGCHGGHHHRLPCDPHRHEYPGEHLLLCL